jgi:site-specific DNA recombinase
VTAVPATFLGEQADWEPWIGYIRISTWKEEKISPELQQAAIEAWALRNRRRIIEWVPDLDDTGRNFKRKIMRAISLVEQGAARGIAVWKYSRFGRSRDGISLNLKRLEDAGGQLASATEDVDARTATGRLQRGILFEFAVYESDVRGEGWRETHDHGRSSSTSTPTGGAPSAAAHGPSRPSSATWTPGSVPASCASTTRSAPAPERSAGTAPTACSSPGHKRS